MTGSQCRPTVIYTRGVLPKGGTLDSLMRKHRLTDAQLAEFLGFTEMDINRARRRGKHKKCRVTLAQELGEYFGRPRWQVFCDDGCRPKIYKI